MDLPCGKKRCPELYRLVYWALYRWGSLRRTEPEIVSKLSIAFDKTAKTIRSHVDEMIDSHVLIHSLGSLEINLKLLHDPQRSPPDLLLRNVVLVVKTEGMPVPADFWDKVREFKERMGIEES